MDFIKQKVSQLKESKLLKSETEVYSALLLLMKNRVTNVSSMKWTFKESVFLFCKYFMFSRYYLVTTGITILVISAHFTLINATDFLYFVCTEQFVTK